MIGGEKMKQYVLAVAVLSLPVLLTGCGNKKTLNCSVEADGEKVEANFVYDGDKFSSGKITMEMDYEKAGLSEDMIKQVKEMKMCDTMTQASADDEDLAKSFDKCTEKWSGSKLTLTITLKKSLGDVKGYKTIDEAKKTIEKSDGYTCKIK